MNCYVVMLMIVNTKNECVHVYVPMLIWGHFFKILNTDHTFDDVSSIPSSRPCYSKAPVFGYAMA